MLAVVDWTLTFLRCLARWLGRDGREELTADHHSAGTASLFAATEEEERDEDEEEEERERLISEQTADKCFREFGPWTQQQQATEFSVTLSLFSHNKSQEMTNEEEGNRSKLDGIKFLCEVICNQ